MVVNIYKYLNYLYDLYSITLSKNLFLKRLNFVLSHPLAPLLTITLSLGAVYFYPGSDRWTPAR